MAKYAGSPCRWGTSCSCASAVTLAVVRKWELTGTVTAGRWCAAIIIIIIAVIVVTSWWRGGASAWGRAFIWGGGAFIWGGGAKGRRFWGAFGWGRAPGWGWPFGWNGRRGRTGSWKVRDVITDWSRQPSIIRFQLIKRLRNSELTPRALN